MKILAFGASSSRHSVNKALAKFVANRVKGADVNLIDLNDYEMPIYSIDREMEAGIPQPAKDFKDHIAAADLVIASFAVHNGSYAVAYKNIFDWASRLDGKVFDGAKVFVMSASPGPMGGQPLLDIVANGIPHFGGELVGKLGIGKMNEYIVDGEITDAELLSEIDHILNSVV